MSNGKQILFPVGRLVAGSLSEPQTTDMDGKPLTVRDGPNAGKAAVRYFFGVAIPKTPGATHWAQEKWGAEIWAVGHQSFPNLMRGNPAQLPDGFAWKIVDGDSGKANIKGGVPNQKEGYPGHWVVSLSSGFAPKCYNNDGSAGIEAVSIKPGYWIQVAATVAGNDSQTKPGVYINHNAVAFQWADKEISFGVDAKSIGFGQGVQRPAGAALTPPGGLTAAPGVAVPPAAPAAPAPHAAPAAPAPVAVQPAPSFVPGTVATVPAAPSAPIAPAAPLAPAVRQMTPAANGVPYEAYRAQGWTDEQLVTAGFLLRG